MISQKDIDYMNECTTRDVIQLLVQEKNMSINEAMKYFYNSKTFKDLLNPETKLFIQSPVYIFDTLESQG
jgi:hypothetical protein